MKAIHNYISATVAVAITVVNKAKIQNESNSQLDNLLLLTDEDCCQ